MAGFDVVIAGAGVVGMACARRLAERGAVLVVERRARPGTETSARNSGVIHAGIYYPTGSLKAELCVRGARLLYDWCARAHVPHAMPGKYLVATSPEEEAPLEALLARAQANGAVEVARASLAQLAADEPRVRARAALWSPRTGIVDPVALVHSLQPASADVLFRHHLTGARRAAHGWTLTLTDENGRVSEVDARWVVNAAGLDADLVAALAGFHCPQYFVKGNYFRFRKTQSFSHLIYPVPPPDHAGVGVHVTLELGGGVRLGPDVEPLGGRAGSLAVDESRREAFAAAAARYLDGVTPDDLMADQAGIRPKVSGGDFVIHEENGWVNLCGIESPGLTSCLAIAERVAALLP
jgi:L-2-hydroxyglutarate oxidase LhgO